MVSTLKTLLRGKNEDLSHLFDNSDAIIASFACALISPLLVQGRLYITGTSVYFYSPFNSSTIFFGKTTRVSIPLNTISKMNKSRMAGLAMVIEIVSEETSHKFTSFLNIKETWESID